MTCIGLSRTAPSQPSRPCGRPLRIALTADPELPVPPRLYGGIERVIDMLARGLAARGHEVTLFAHPDSASAGGFVPWPGASSRSPTDTGRNAVTLAARVLRGRFDLVHSFSRIAYLTPILPHRIPKIMSYQRAISPHTVKWGEALSRGSLSFTAISHWMMQHVRHLGNWVHIPNGVPLSAYSFNPQVGPDAPLVFLGRIEEIKGPHLAIDIARRCDLPLVIAGNVPDEHRRWAEEHVLCHVDGDRVRYAGPVDDIQKNLLLGRARALLMPVLWDEPFGIVMAEAMACGTPVLGLSRGAVGEVVEDGVTGFVRKEVQELAVAAGRLDQISRRACRSRVERHYGDDAVVDAYLARYRAVAGVSRTAS